MKHFTQVGLGAGHIVLNGDIGPLPQKDTAPQFSAHICCGQMALWIKMALGQGGRPRPKRHCLRLGTSCPLPQKWGRPRLRRHCVRWEPSSPSPKRRQSTPILGPCLLWPNGCMDQGATWYGGRPRSRPHCATWGTSSPSPKRAHSPL